MRTKKPHAIASPLDVDIDARVVAEAENDTAWEAPISVHRAAPAALELPADLAARAAFLARVHHAAGVAEWLTRVIRERVELEEGAFAAAKREMSAR
jgi:predicted RNA-binding Zn ribbon-like protein